MRRIRKFPIRKNRVMVYILYQPVDSGAPSSDCPLDAPPDLRVIFSVQTPYRPAYDRARIGNTGSRH